MSERVMRYPVAVIQFEPRMFAMEENLARLVALTEEAAHHGARLIVHPEMATTGYCWANRAEITPYVEPVPGPTTDRFGEIARRYGCYIVVAVAEVVPATGIYYNSAVLIGPHGVVGVYRKTHAYISEPKWAKDGDLGIPVFETELGRIAITICMDATFPETGRVPALAGADVICFPTNWLGEPCPSPVWMARALDNGVFFLAANRYGLERGVQFCGGSCVIDPSGAVQSSLRSGVGIVYGMVDLAAARDRHWILGAAEHKFADRRPSAYSAITLNTYRWQDRDFHGLYGISPLPAGRISEIAVVQFSPETGAFDANLQQIDTYAQQHRGAGLIVFPELATCGPVDDTIAAGRVAKAIDQIIGELIAIAARANVHLVVGIVDVEGDTYFNAAVVAGPEGEIGRYRKVHLTEGDRRWATAGDRLRWFDLPAGRTGIAIGYDAAFPETTTCLAIEGCDLIACPAHVTWPPVQTVVSGEWEIMFHLWRERARETNTMVAFANGAAPAMGWSGIFGPVPDDEPENQIFISSDEPGGISLPIDTTNLETRFITNPLRAKETIAMRVPIWYDPIQAPNLVVESTIARERLATRAGDD